MVVTVQSGESILISSGETFRALEIQNAGTVSNAGTSSQLKSARLATGSGVGSGLGSAVSQRQTPRLATGTGSGVGSSITTRFEQISASGIGSGVGSSITTRFEQISASGIGSGVGSAVSKLKTDTVAAGTGSGLGLGSAVSKLKTDTVAAGTGSGVGSAITQFKRLSVARGSGLGAGSAITQFKRLPVATGSGLGAGSATTTRFEQISASGIGLGFGSATNPVPFDPIRQIVRLLESTNETAWRYGKPERIAPIWEYSHNDRVNYPDPALYIYTPAESVVDKFGIEGDNFNQTITIEILIMTLESSETQGYVGDTTTLITQLFDDNAKNSNFHRFSNVNAADLRNEHITQQTDHYLASVTFEIQRFAPIRDLQEVGAFR